MKNGVIASLLIVAVLAGAGVGYLVGNLNERTVTTTSTFNEVSTATTTTSVTPSTTVVTGGTGPTLPCGSPGVTCGGVNITSASLTVNGSYSVLRVTITETGNAYIGSATVYVNGTVIGVPPASEYEPPGNIPLDVEHGQQAVLVLTIPNSTMPIRAGLTYSVQVYVWEGPIGQRASAGGSWNVTVRAD